METNKNKSKSSSEIVSKLVQSPIRKGYIEIMEDDTNAYVIHTVRLSKLSPTSPILYWDIGVD